ncbi:DUF5825 family protein [Streptomyces mangrovi]|uniref:DUF5825 family protein n=1 Tax=Streptomyces mangrovi TaxID=1206892 RepID=UPI00399C7251
MTQTANRRSLFLDRPPGVVQTRDELVMIVRSGMRGFRLTEPLHLTPEDPNAATAHLAFLRDAAGVGLRVIWRGTVTGLPVSRLTHLDPPRSAEGAMVWPVPRRPLLTVRHGPGYVLVEDSRDVGVRRFVLDAPDEVRALLEPALSRVEESALDHRDLAAISSLAERGLFLRVGTTWLALPVRFRYART